MNVCFKCERETDKLIDSITPEGIVGLCKDCADDALILEKPNKIIIEKEETFRERINSFEKNVVNQNKEIEQDTELKKIVAKNIEKDLNEEIEEGMLVRNFHWIVMRARRLKKLTSNELAKKISAPKELIEFIEKGKVSKNSVDLIRKLELFFNIELFTQEARKKLVRPFSKIGFDPIFSKSLTIDDLMKMKKKKESKDDD